MSNLILAGEKLKIMDQMRHVFAVDVLERYAAKGKGVITCMSAGNDVIVLGTSKGWLIRHDFTVGDSSGIFSNPCLLAWLLIPHVKYFVNIFFFALYLFVCELECSSTYCRMLSFIRAAG